MSSIEDNPGYGCSGPKSTNELCDCLGCNIERIATATEAIAKALEEKTQDACKNIDKCIDKIIEGINNKYGKSLASVDQCKLMIQQGLGGTLEYAIKCAGQARDKCTSGCSPGEGATEGGCCTSCGQEKCVCKNYECVPVEEQPKDKWIGWCNKDTGQVAVTKQGQGAPGVGFVQVALADSEQAALSAAEFNCQSGKEPGVIQLPIPPQLPPFSGGSPDCNAFGYLDGSAFNRLNAQQVTANIAEGIARQYKAAAAIGLDGITVGNAAEALIGIFQAQSGFNSSVTQEISIYLASALGCNDGQFQQSIQALCALSSASNYIGFNLQPWATPYVYAANAACRHTLASPAEATAAYLANRISAEALDAIYSVHGLCHDVAEWNIGAQRSKPVPAELMRLRRRKMYDAEQYQSGMRQLGFLEPQVSEDLYKLSEQVPTLAEIIRMMVRDSDDEELVKRFGLDTEFDKKYGKQLKEWSEFQGVSEQHARYDWRAHWSIPSPTQLFEFYRRLRYRPEFGGKEQMEKDIRSALIQQDILPFWHQYYLAVQFRPMRLVDIRRSFQIGALTDGELIPAYLDLGFSDTDAERMAKFTRILRDRSVISERAVKLWLRLAYTKQQAIAELTAQGIPQDVIDKALAQAEPDFIKSPYGRAFMSGDIDASALRSGLSQYGVSDDTINNIIKIGGLKRKSPQTISEYEAGLIDKDAAVLKMVEDGVDGNAAKKLLDRVDREIRVQFLKRCQQGIKQRYLLGELSQDEASAELIARGTVPSRAHQMVDWWGCELKSGDKNASVSQLCDWLSRGAISPAQMLNRLERIGYSSTDSALILEDCTIKLTAAAQAKAQREAKAQAQERQRTARILQQQARQTERFLAQQKSNAQKAAALKQRREKTLLSAVEKWYPKIGLPLPDATQLMREQYSRLKANYALSIDEALQVLVTAASEFDGSTAAEFEPFVSTIAESVVQANLSGEPSELWIPPSTNGETVPS